MSSPQTSKAGVGTLVAGIGGFLVLVGNWMAGDSAPSFNDIVEGITACGTAIAAGVGLLRAADSKKVEQVKIDVAQLKEDSK